VGTVDSAQRTDQHGIEHCMGQLGPGSASVDIFQAFICNW